MVRVIPLHNPISFSNLWNCSLMVVDTSGYRLSTQIISNMILWKGQSTLSNIQLAFSLNKQLSHLEAFIKCEIKNFIFPPSLSSSHQGVLDHMLIVPSNLYLCWINYCYKEWLHQGAAMQSLVAPTQDIVFDIETALEMQLGVKPLPFPGMDSKSCRPITIVTLLFDYLI